MNKKGQAAMEFLMTYGWAIIVVLAAIGALAYFGVLSPSNLLPARTTFQAPVPNVDIAVIEANGGAADAGTVTIAFRNNVGSTITVTDIINASDDCGGIGTTKNIAVGTGAFGAIGGGVDVQNGDAFRLQLSCASGLVVGDRFASDIVFQYTNKDSGLSRPQKGTVEGEVV